MAEDNGAQQQRELPESSSLVSWVMERVAAWEDYRKQNFDSKWDEYYRLWRGFWEQKDKNRDSERSRLIAPALSQAIEATVSELEEATFAQGKWFDVDDNYLDEDKTDIAMWRDQLDEDLTKENVQASISEVFLNGALYGTGIAKVIIKQVDEKYILPEPINDTTVTQAAVVETPVVRVGLLPVHPKEFVIDPTARKVDEALGCAHITEVPKHTVQKKQQQGIYRDVPLTGYTDSIVGGRHQAENDNSLKDIREQDKTMLVEYHGFVPRNLIEEGEEEVVDLFADDVVVRGDETDMVEAIVTIANGTTLLRAVKNPYVMGDRCFIAYQHDTVPNRFWGRGIAEKGYNPQKALDAELRGRIDAMAMSIHPMMAVDATRIHRGADFRIAPGRSIFTTGDPKSILMPFNFGQVNNNTFAQSGELERMVQMGTGAMDSATPLSENRRNETSSGMSMIMSGSIKRSKRTLANIERNFTRPFINKAAWRYMQFAPDRYPVTDIEFNVHSTLGMIARELEQQQLASMMNTVPPESPAFWMLLKGIFEYSSISNREQMLPIIDMMMKTALQKQMEPPQPDPIIAVKREEIQIKAKMEEAKLQMEAGENQKDAEIEYEKLKLEYEKLKLKEKEMNIDAQLEAAKIAQDDRTVEMQMRQSSVKEPSSPKQASAPVVNIIEKMEQLPEPPAKPKKKRLKIARVGDGFEGTSEEIDEEALNSVVEG